MNPEYTFADGLSGNTLSVFGLWQKGRFEILVPNSDKGDGGGRGGGDGGWEGGLKRDDFSVTLFLNDQNTISEAYVWP